MGSTWRAYRARKEYMLPSETDASKALDELYSAIRQELDHYRQLALRRGDTPRAARADEALDWVARRGSSIITRYKKLAEVNDWTVERKIAEAARALLALGRIAKRRDMSDIENWDVVRDWAEQALGMLEAGIGTWLEEEATQVEDFSEDVLPMRLPVSHDPASRYRINRAGTPMGLESVSRALDLVLV